MTLLEGREGPFFDPWETLAEGERSREIPRRLGEYLDYARRLPFYLDRLAKADPGSPHPLRDVPALTSSDLRDLVPPGGRGLLVGEAEKKGYTVFQSGGTTGTPKTTLFSHAELEGLNLPNARGFFAVGLEPSDRVANLWAVGSLYMTFVHINRMLQQYGCLSFPFSNHTPVDFINTVVKAFGVNTLSGIGSVVLNAVRALDEGVRIEKIYYGGEHLYEADIEEIERKVGARIIKAPGYGTVDTWYLGYQCGLSPMGVFHAHDDQTYLEIVDEETGDLCPPGEAGMLFATAYPRRLTPIVRYRVGDRAKWLGERCPCGRTTPLFKLLGRGDDVLRVGYDSVDYNAVQAVITRVGGLTGTLQMEKQRVEGKDRLCLRIEADVPAETAREKAAAVEREVLDSRPSLREFVKKGTVWPVAVEIVPTGSLPRNPRTGKLMRVIDAIKEV